MQTTIVSTLKGSEKGKFARRQKLSRRCNKSTPTILSGERPKVLLAKKDSNKLFDKLLGKERRNGTNYSLLGSDEILVLLKKR